MQRKIDVTLRVHRDYFFRAYVNDIIIFNNILGENISHLHSGFQLVHMESVYRLRNPF